MVAVVQGDVIDCTTLLNSMNIYRFDQIELKNEQPTRDLHGGLYAIYAKIQQQDLQKITLILDHLLSMNFELGAIVSVLKDPVVQPFFVFDIKPSNGYWFFGAYFSLGNEFQDVCIKHEFMFNQEKSIWYKKIPVGVEQDVNIDLQVLAEFFNDIKRISRIFFYKSTFQKFYRVA